MSDVALDDALRALTDPGAIMERVVSAALELIDGAEGSVVELVDGPEMVYAHARGVLAPFVGLRLRARDSLSGLCVAQGVTLYCEDSERDSRVDREACRRVAARSLVCVPLRSGTANLGVLKVSSATPRAFSEHDVETLAGLSTFIAAALASAAALGASTEEAIVASHRRDEAAARDSGTATFVGRVLGPDVIEDLHAAQRIRDALAQRPVHIVHQPIFDLGEGRAVMSEALARFTVEPERAPDVWFREAWRVGLGAELEFLAASVALEDLERLPEDCRLAINASPALLEHPLGAAIASWPHLERLVLEITEHVDAEDFAHTRDFLAPLRARGLRVAMDDAGNGYSSLQRMIALAPDIIKLDLDLVRGIDHDPVRRSLATAIVSFATDIGATLVAEGVEHPDELASLRALGVPCVQGYLLARPGPVEAVGAPVTFAVP